MPTRTPSAESQSTRALSSVEQGYLRQRLARLLKEHDDSQTALANAIGMSQQGLSKIFSGNAAPGLYVVKKVAAFTGMTETEVLSAPQQGIEDALSAHARRWEPATIAAVRAMPKSGDLSADDAVAVLDKTEAALLGVRKEVQKLTRR